MSEPSLQTILFIRSERGQILLREAAALPADRLTRLTHLRKRCTPPQAAYLVSLLELRKRAERKFAQAAHMVFTEEGLQQSTGETLARCRAARFPFGEAILDVCAGIGGDALSLRQRGPTVAVDLNAAHCACVRANAALPPAPATNPAFPVYVVCQDAGTLDLPRLRDGGVTGAFFDPSRRSTRTGGGRGRVVNPDDYAPPLDFALHLRTHCVRVAVKVSPAIDDGVLGHWQREHGARVEFCSERGECKEAVLWLGDFPSLPTGGLASPSAPFATILRPDSSPATLTGENTELPEASPPLRWLIEPDPAVIRAGLVPTLAAQHDWQPLNPQIAYLTGDAPAATPFATCYPIVDALPYHVKGIQARLRASNAFVAVVKKRGVDLDPETARKQFRPAGDRPLTLVLARTGSKILALLCDPPTRSLPPEPHSPLA